MADVPIPQFDLFQMTASARGLIPPLLEPPLTMLLRELMLVVVVGNQHAESANE
ncbi:MAG TPA: hypothetical protein VMB34_11210 [Acetobacteraceae bacterium]|nr:hypothetical protein [Acetobacteraceae bacterium]